nr:rhodanese-like domain-containing protein [uncultured Aquabacterium sp.]
MNRLLRLFRMASALFVAIATVTATTAHAQVRTDGLAMPQALQGLPAAGSQCGLSPAEKLQAQQAAALPAPDARCLLSTSELSHDKALSEWTWVDVRRPDLAEADAQPGALRLSPELLRSKAFLKTRRVLLVGDGHAQAALLSQCRRLKDEGFKQVRVLNGGWPQWRFQQGLQSSSTESLSAPAPLSAPALLSASALWAESQHEGNLVIGTRADGLIPLLPFGATLDAWSVERVRALIERRRHDSPGVPLASVVLVHAPERSVDVPLAALRQALHPTPVLVHVGQASALRTQLAQMEAAWVARERGPKQPRCGQ